VIPTVLALAAATAVSFAVTADPAAQALIDRGLLEYYAYDGGDAANSFAAAAQRQSELAMAYWGEALADGPDLNTAMTEERFVRGSAAAGKAVALEATATLRERRFIDAMALRYRGTWSDWKDDDAAYRDAMVSLTNDGSGVDGDAAALLTAEALFETGGLTWTGSSPASADARRGLALIDGVLVRDPENAMANHLCLHLYDFAPDRSPARACAQHLDAAVLPPQAEHLAHMPAHYWIEVGDYAAALASSERAYRLFMQLQNVPGRDPDHDRYLTHDVYVGYSAAMMLSDYAVARAWSQRMSAVYATPYDALTALRFGRYTDAFALARDATPTQLAIRGLAALELGDDASARDAADRLRKLTTYGDLVQIFFGTLAQHEGRYDEAAHWIDRAVETQRQAYAAELIPLLPALEVRGALALQRAAYDDAESAYRAALAAYPNDPRAQAGLAAAHTARSRKP
jgi:tetratricopeptide (TPR) repeat protein